MEQRKANKYNLGGKKNLEIKSSHFSKSSNSKGHSEASGAFQIWLERLNINDFILFNKSET